MLVEEIERMKIVQAEENRLAKLVGSNSAQNTNVHAASDNNKLPQTTNETPQDSDFTPQIKLGISLLIPEAYMQDLALRMSFYKKIANIKSEEAQDQLIDEMRDRFGKIPEEIFNLMQVSRLKHQCQALGIEKLEAMREGISISFHNNKFKAPEQLLQMIFASGGKIKLQQNQKILFLNNVSDTNSKIAAAFVNLAKLLAIC